MTFHSRRVIGIEFRQKEFTNNAAGIKAAILFDPDRPNRISLFIGIGTGEVGTAKRFA